jgi:hypothetical protein
LDFPPSVAKATALERVAIIVYFMTHLLRIETQVADGEKLSEFLNARK